MWKWQSFETYLQVCEFLDTLEDNSITKIIQSNNDLVIFYFLKKDNITKSKIQQITYKTITVNNAFNLDIELNKYTAAGWSICYIQSDLTNDYDYFTVVCKKEGD